MNDLFCNPIKWNAGEFVISISAAPDRVVELFRESDEESKSLPVEFFARELLECDPQNTDSLIDFVSEWGLPFHPSRFGRYSMGSLERRERVYRAIEATDAIMKESCDARAHLSMEEASLSVADMQECVRGILSYVEGIAETCDLALVNAASANPWNVSKSKSGVQISDDGKSMAIDMMADWDNRKISINDVDCENHMLIGGTLTNAVCNQIIDTVLSDAPWKQCAHCGRVFKHQRNNSSRQPKTSKKPSDATYCSSTCRENAKKKRQRANAAANPAR